MTVVVDANVAIAVLDPADCFHLPALRRCLADDDVIILNLTRAEALIHPAREGLLAEADALLDSLGLRTVTIENEVAERSRDLWAQYGSRRFPMIDAVVVAYGAVCGCPVVTGDARWPRIDGVEVELLAAP